MIIVSCHALSHFSLRVSSVFDHFGYPAPPISEWRHAKWYNLRLVQEALGDMQNRLSNGLTPLPSAQVLSPTRRDGPPAPHGYQHVQGVTASGSSSCPEIDLKSPCSAAGKAQVASAAQTRGSGGGSKGIRLEDSSTSKVAKCRCLAKQTEKFRSGQPCFEDTFEESEDSNESFNGPFSGSSPAVAVSSTTADTPPAVQYHSPRAVTSWCRNIHRTIFLDAC